ncbi:right-handed parallel beta-helix repeat-containing protein [Algoriphagus lacus]|uniref:Right-handed parallel beta-helix repeat-containing protein n=1 Tax=Algoriphagus lacus TaxID=2056311 RepID=A0A418PTP6_9BACT|nr:right-handed parallel beta-helix repeat-containing protein [Algoriphagus lacus]RIW16454.1 right-handed parallel beta-helix repeat-containing protein [Algoriphagus lacus]
MTTNRKLIPLLGILIVFTSLQSAKAKDYFFHPQKGNDQNSGLNAGHPFQSLSKIKDLTLQPGDRILLAGGEVFRGTLELVGFKGSSNHPLFIQSYWDEGTDSGQRIPAKIDAKGFANGVLIENSSFVQVRNMQITGDGYGEKLPEGTMRVGVLILATGNAQVKGITLDSLRISEVFFEEKGFIRGAQEVKSANGTQRYGWGIRLINQSDAAMIEEVKILNSQISNVSHTGIKLTGNQSQNIRRITIAGNKVTKVGGPGIQMSGVKFVHVTDNEVAYSGSTDDSRKWGRGSGLWTWGASNVLIEKNKFMYANGPGDSAGAHIDYNCDNVVLQYNLSAHNAGGFIEVLGNNYNCAYRYNISVNDGHRIKGQDGAFQEGKTFWLSGYQGEKKPRKGPVNSYFYNNTIYVAADLVSKIAVDNGSKGILIANNIFHIIGKSEQVAGDQYVPDDISSRVMEEVFFKNNLFLHENSWPSNAIIQAQESRFGDPGFVNPGGLNPEDYIPTNLALTQNGIEIPQLPGDRFGLIEGLKIKKDFLGNLIEGNPGIGAIQVLKLSTESLKAK